MPRGWGAATGGTRSVGRGPADYFKPNSWNARCWQCYRKCKSDEMFKLDVWTGNAWVCHECFEVVNPQQFVRGIPDRMNVPWVQNPPPILIESGAPTNTQIKSGGTMTGSAMTGSGMTA